jgi:hypothetical protein
MQFIIVLAGANFRSAEARASLKSLAKGASLSLARDPTNAYDKNAVKVLVRGVDAELNESEIFLGFIPAASNPEIAALLDGRNIEGELFAPGHTPTVDRCEIIDFVSGPLKPTIVIEISTGFELGTLVRSDADTDEDGDADYLVGDEDEADED